MHIFRVHLLAACMMHVEGYFSTKSLAYKHHNPGNIRGKDGEFIHYVSISDGYEALVRDIDANDGMLLADFIAKYAPPNENNTSLYLALVSELSGIKPEEAI